MKLTIQEIAKGTGGRLEGNGSVHEFNSVSIDTRTIKSGDLYVAIKGTHFDGHSFIGDAIEKGAAGVVKTADHRQQTKDLSERGVWEIVVDDTVKALGDIAHVWRNKISADVVAVTGSNGKSTTKEMIAQGVFETRRVVKTEGNFNNLIGLPLQVMRISEQDEVAVMEMGMNAPGEIFKLAKIATPNVGLITNVNPAHLEKLQTVENVAKAKGELFDAMDGKGTLVINSEDPLVVKLAERFKNKKITFGMQNSCDVRFGRLISEGLSETHLSFYVQGKELAMNLPVPGVHNVMNALAAMAVGLAIGVKPITMIPALERFNPMRMRMERVQLLNGVQVINDCYNANPSSMLAALRTVGSAKRAGRFIAVLGDMLELGEASKEKHLELGRNAVLFKVEKVFAVGKFAGDIAGGAIDAGMEKKNVTTADTAEELKEELLGEIRTGDVVLVKGSRGVKMEVLVDYLKNKIGA